MTMEDEQMQTEDVQTDADIQLPPMANQDVCNKILGLGIASAACEGMEDDAARTKCRVDHIRPIEDGIGKPGEMSTEDELAKLFVAHPGMSDNVINQMNLIIGNAIERAQKIVDAKQTEAM